MAQTIHITQEPVVLEGYQAIMKPSKFGYSLSAIVDQALIDRLDAEREDLLKWGISRLKNPNRGVQKPEPWEEVADNRYKIKFSWDEKAKPPVVDSEGTPITDLSIPLYNGSKVKLAFRQKPYVLQDKVTYGTSLKLAGVQVITVNGSAGVDTGDLDETEVAALFGQTKGFKTSEPNVTPFPSNAEEVDDDF